MPHDTPSLEPRATAPRGRRWLRWGALLLAAVAVVAQGYAAVRATSRPGSVLEVYRQAGRAVLEGADLYAVRTDSGLRFMYPPLFALLAAPLGWLSRPAAAVVWYALSAGLYALLIAASAQLARPLGGSRLRRTAWPLALTLPYASANFLYGQASVLMASLAVVGLAALDAERRRAGAAAIALVAALKPLGAIVILDPMLRRELGVVGWAAAFGGLLGLVLPALALGPAAALRSVGAFAALAAHIQAGGEGPSFLNQSLRAALERAGVDESLTLAHHLGALGLLAATALVIGRVRPPRALAGGLLLCLIPCVAATGWKHHFVVLALPYAVFAAGWERLPRLSRGLAGLSALLTLSRLAVVLDGDVALWLGLHSATLGAALSAWLGLVVAAFGPGSVPFSVAPNAGHMTIGGSSRETTPSGEMSCTESRLA